MKLLPLLAALLVGCGGATSPESKNGDASTDSPVDSAIDSGGGYDSGCPGPPSSPIYGCDAAAPGEQGCGPWNSTNPGPIYPVGCVVTTTMEGTYCGPVTCNCTTELADSAAMWVCPL